MSGVCLASAACMGVVDTMPMEDAGTGGSSATGGGVTGGGSTGGGGGTGGASGGGTTGGGATGGGATGGGATGGGVTGGGATGGGATGGGATGGGGTAMVTPGGPVLFFSDLANGPRRGNSDTSFGQTANQDGVYVSVWGKNLGATQGSSTVTVGGQSARVVYWGPATHGADLSRRMGMQLIELQVPGSAPLGSAELQVTVGGVPSNTLPFTTRDVGRIFFIKVGGADTNNGSFTQPWATFDAALATIGDGDVVYFGDGVTDSDGQNDTGMLGLNESGTAQLPRAVVAYPGATVVIGGTQCEPTGHALVNNWSSAENGGSKHWVISKLTIKSPPSCQQDSAVVVADGYRLVGNFLSTPRTSDGCQTGTVSCGGLGTCGSNLFVLGNELAFSQTVNAATGSKQCHGFYISGNRTTAGLESGRDLGWNYVHDNANNRGINIYNESYNGASAPRAQIERHAVHDNWVENQRGIGLLMGADITGDNWVFNNVFVNTGLGPVFVDGGGFFPFQLQPGSAVPVRPTRLFVFNNLIYGASFPQGPDYAVALVNWEQAMQSTLDFRNNVVVGTQSGVPYVNQYSDPFMSSFNLWAGAGALPMGATSSLNTAPAFVSAGTFDFHFALGSAGRGAGTDLSALGIGGLDFDGIPRTGAWSMGPFQ